jgi:hypothetical protein
VQGEVFDFYQALLEATIAQARREGRYDDGITDVAGTSVTLAEAPQARARKNPSGNKTLAPYIAADAGIRMLMPDTLSSKPWQFPLLPQTSLEAEAVNTAA